VEQRQGTNRAIVQDSPNGTKGHRTDVRRGGDLRGKREARGWRLGPIEPSALPRVAPRQSPPPQRRQNAPESPPTGDDVHMRPEAQKGPVDRVPRRPSLPVQLTPQRKRGTFSGPTKGPTKTPVFYEPSVLAAGDPSHPFQERRVPGLCFVRIRSASRISYNPFWRNSFYRNENLR
jgi:hypothetical protein